MRYLNNNTSGALQIQIGACKHRGLKPLHLGLSIGGPRVVLYNCRPKVMRNAKPNFINFNSCLHIALRRAPRRRVVWCSGLTAALNLFLRCAFHHSTKFESANTPTSRQRQIRSAGFAYPPPGGVRFAHCMDIYFASYACKNRSTLFSTSLQMRWTGIVVYLLRLHRCVTAFQHAWQCHDQ